MLSQKSRGTSAQVAAPCWRCAGVGLIGGVVADLAPATKKR